METTSNSETSVSGDGGEAEPEYFDDFTLASTWERFISEIEVVCRTWLAAGPKNLSVKDANVIDPLMGLRVVKSEIKYNMKSYCMEYYFETGKMAVWTQPIHDLQLAFGVKEFLVIAPQSASGVILDAPEASKLLSAVAIALSNCSCRWPAFVPVHDPSRKAFIGIQNMGTVFTRRFEADRISSQVPVKLMHLEGLYELFISKFAYAAVDLSWHNIRVQFKMKLTYRTPTHDDEDELHESDSGINENGENDSFVDANGKMQWDADCQWSEWYSAEDPVQEYELIAVWKGLAAENSLYMAELENASPLEADQWFLCPRILFTDNVSDGKMIGFASSLRLLVEAFKLSLEARFMEDFVSVENSSPENVRSSGIIPPPTVLDRVLKDLFHEAMETPVNISVSENKSYLAIKGAPVDSLFAQFCLHALWFGNCNIRAIAVLWIEFVREVRWCWEESQPLPRVPANGTIDLSTCLIHQKLHMLAICIDRKLHQAGGDGVNRNSSSETHVGGATSNQAAEEYVTDTDRKGSLGVAGSMMLLKLCKSMHEPVTQDPPPMTEDMHEERLEAVAALGNLVKFSGQLERDVLVSDMSSFKAANPDAFFEDFIRWYSPKDWEDDDDKVIDGLRDDLAASLKTEWPPHGRLSERMSDVGNSWRKIWNEAPALPASEQKPLLDPKREGEKVLHYLETLPPDQLLGQMVCTAFRAAADTLNRTSFGDLKLMTTKMRQLYPTMASTLKSIHSPNVASDSDVFEDLRRLCISFGHIEKLTLLAASLNHKFARSPRLAEAFFNDYHSYYLPQMGTSSTPGLPAKEFEKRQQILPQERMMVADMFTPPTPSQSWRKVLSMGNLLNGNEPILREIIFSKSDEMSDSYYASCDDDDTDASEQGILETYRMYVCGTSNDLRVALAVASCD